MSVAICSWSSTSVPFPLEKKEVLGSLLMSVPTRDDVAMVKNDEGQEVERPPGQFDIWTSIKAAHKAKQSKENDEEPYVHPLMKHSSSLMTQNSLQVCTESLGSETGSDNYFSSDDDDDDDDDEVAVDVDVDVDYSMSSPRRRPTKRAVGVVDEHAGVERKEHAAASVNYHCSVGRRSPRRSFPPPLPSISCRDGPCVQMRPRRKDGRLVLEAVAVPSQNYLHAERQGGRLLLSFIKNATPPKRNANTDLTTEQTQQVAEEEEVVVVDELEDQEEGEEEEEEVEVVDRGTVVEVKVSTQPQKQSGGSAAMKVHRSSIVINKFVSCTPSSSRDRNQVDVDVVNDCSDGYETTASLRRSTTGTTTAAAAAVAASSLSTFPADGSLQPCSDNKLLFITTKRRRNREELLTDMKRCSQLRKPLFIWETNCIATSSS